LADPFHAHGAYSVKRSGPSQKAADATAKLVGEERARRRAELEALKREVEMRGIRIVPAARTRREIGDRPGACRAVLRFRAVLTEKLAVQLLGYECSRQPRSNT
jgi:hypothetical protein